MKKLIIITILILTSVSFSQNTGVPGKDYFPYMSFWDFAVYPKHARQEHNCSSQAYVDSMLLKSFYYPLLVDLGLTNIVSDFGFIKSYPSLNSTYGNIKFLDMDFGWDGNGDGPFDPGRYVKATGNNPDKFGHQIGGDWSMTWNPYNKNYGFGTTTKSSRWAMDSTKQPAGSPGLTGDNISDYVPPILSEQSQVRYAERGNHATGGTMFYGNIEAGHFPHADTTYQLSFFIRGDANELEKEVDPHAVVLSIYVIPGDALYQRPYNSNITIEEPNLTEGIETNFLSAAYEVTAGQLMDSAGTYRWITTPAFKVPGDTNIAYYAVWTGEATIYCDRMIMFNEFYDRMFNPTQKNNPVAPPDFSTQITTKYQGSNPALHSMYVDEPPLLATEAFSHINDLVWSTLSGSSTAMELNGAIGPHAEWGMRFDQQYGKSSLDNNYKRKYLLYNVYPFRQELGTTQSDVQTALEELVNYRFIGDDATEHSYQYLGLRPAIRAAKKFDTQLNNDIPLIYILQVHAEHLVYNSGSQFSIVPNATSMRRAPTRDEIFVQGNMALAYGAKGFMFYMLPTWNAEPEPNKTVWNTYGIFDEFQNHYLGTDGEGLVQNPCNAQEPNYRYHATKALIEDTRKIENKILGLNWLDAISWHSAEDYTIDWISEVYTQYPGTFYPQDVNKYVEIGYFNELNPPSGKLVDPKYIYLVNRRCNIQEPDLDDLTTDNSDRNITFRLNMDTTFRNYTVTDLKTDSVYYTTNDGWVTLFLKAGHGTLLKIEPTVQTGGTLVTNETIRSGSNTVDTTLVVPQNVKLTINAGAKLTFMKSGKLLILDGQLEVKGTPTNKVEFDFVAKNWSAANGIFAYRTPLKISNAIIKNASCGIYSHVSPGDTIDGVSTENTHTGISLYYSYNYGSDNTVIRNSSFEDSQLWGITMVGSRPRIHNNWFTNITEKAISASTGSAPVLLRTADTVGNNRFRFNGTSIYAINSTPVLGTVDSKENYIGGNCFYEDTTSLKVVFENYQTADISAYGNDWATENPSEFRIELVGDVTVQTDGYNSDCSGIWLNPNMLSGGSSSPKQMESGEGEDSVKTVLQNARKLIRKGQLRDALSLLTGLIKGQCDLRYKRSAVSLVPECFAAGNTGELKTTLLELRGENGLFKPATMLLMNIDTENMDVYKQEILNSGNNKMNGAGDNSEEVMIAFNNLLEEKYNPGGVIDTAGKVAPLLAYLNGNHPGSEYTKLANQLFSELPEGNPANKPMVKQHPGGSKPETVVYEYNLYNNYPNPFNPETVIKFSLKEKSNVTLTVYSITGQKVVPMNRDHGRDGKGSV